VAPEEIVPHLLRGRPNTIRDFIDIHQPDIYLRNSKSIAHNVPLRSLVFVHETEEALALIYWTECLGEDLEYGRFGTTVKQLIETKNRPTDFDWVLEALVSKENGALQLANIAAPYHNRTPLVIDSSADSSLPLRIASPNNNVEDARGSAVLKLPKFRPRPQIYTHDERNTVLYGTGKDTATLSLLDHSRRGNINLNDEVVVRYLGSLGLDLASLQP
jgi:hypothetical protein